MKQRKLEEELFNKLLNGEYKNVLEVINSDDTLTPVLRGERLDVYYRGCLCFSLTIENIQYNNEYKNKVVHYDLNQYPAINEIVENIPYYKQNIDYWFSDGKRAYEREFSQLILRENNSLRLGNETDYFILDMEYQYEQNGSNPEPDLLSVRIPRNERGKNKTVQLAFIEVKYGDKALYNDGKAGIKEHIEDYVNLIRDSVLLENIKKDMQEVFKQEKELGFLYGLKDKSDSIKFNDNKPELILALIGHNTNSGKRGIGKSLQKILKETIEQFGEKELDAVYVAKTSELGFGLHEDKLINIKDYVEQ